MKSWQLFSEVVDEIFHFHIRIVIVGGSNECEVTMPHPTPVVRDWTEICTDPLIHESRALVGQNAAQFHIRMPEKSGICRDIVKLHRLLFIVINVLLVAEDVRSDVLNDTHPRLVLGLRPMRPGRHHIPECRGCGRIPVGGGRGLTFRSHKRFSKCYERCWGGRRVAIVISDHHRRAFASRITDTTELALPASLALSLLLTNTEANSLFLLKPGGAEAPGTAGAGAGAVMGGDVGEGVMGGGGGAGGSGASTFRLAKRRIVHLHANGTRVPGRHCDDFTVGPGSV
mmetsp:Transcript_28281/g.39321  ORF Transcript_28281/g.39321 Transcript_28281/m.39321 type:complete len:285 (-) Transcript_28281:802-1656(-)